MDNTPSSGSTGYQGHLINISEGRILQNVFQYSDFPLRENYSNPQHVDILGGHVNSHQSSNSTIAKQNQASSGPMNGVHNGPPRVHINPNFRPKLIMGTGQCSRNSQHSRVHVNPHWRGKVDAVPEITPNQLQKKLNHSNSGKTTIFVNPKVLPHLRLEPTSCSEIEESVPNHQIICPQTNILQSESSQTHLETSFTDGSQTNIPIQGSEKEIAVLHLNVPNSVELVCAEKPLRNIPYPNSVTRSFVENKTGQSCKRRHSSFNNFESSKQTYSKYKLVRKSPGNACANLKIIKGSSAVLLKRPKKKAENLTIPNSKSIYKFVRSAASSTVTKEQLSYKQANNIADTISSVAENTCEKHVLRSGTLKKTVKSKYKLDRMPLSQKYHSELQPGSTKTKTVQTRTSLDNATTLARRVSRFRIVSTSSIIKPQAKRLPKLVKVYKSEPNPNLINCKAKRLAVYGNISWKNEKTLTSSKSVFKPSLTRSNQTSKQSSVVSSTKPSNRSLVNIGGVLYRSTRTSLTRTKSNESKEQVLNIRGKKFVLDNKGTVLTPKHDPCDVSTVSKMKSSLSRVDIGGVTFTRRSDNTLVRTNTHFARNLVSFAKMRSIAFLRGKLCKNNQPCLIYHRFGKCRAHDFGKCWRVHDPKNISICKRFLQGNCEAEKCFLSHNVGPEKMPTCHHFLEGCCVRDNCPYLHVKLSSHAAICREFLNGYCAAGDMCKKRHIFICPDFDRLGKCGKGKYCPYPHKTIPKISIRKEVSNNSGKRCKKKKIEKIGAETDTSGLGDLEKRKRYYDESKKPTVDQTISNPMVPENDSVDEGTEQRDRENSPQKRTKLGILPAYIPLE